MALPTDEEVAAARRQAVDANIIAMEAESIARKARSKANGAQRHYEDLLEARDYMTIDEIEEHA